jgi:predicted hydrocarbon binding protein
MPKHPYSEQKEKEDKMNPIKKAFVKAAGKRTRPMLNLISVEVGALSKAFYLKYGNEALPVIVGVVSQCGMEWGKIMQQTMPKRSMKAAGEGQKMMGEMMGYGIELVELSDDKLHFKIAHCPFGIEGTSKELCEAMMTMDEKRMSTFLGKDVCVEVLQTLAAGDKLCEVIFSKK